MGGFCFARRPSKGQLVHRVFGFHAAPEDLATATDWIQVVESVGFKMVSSERVSARTATNSSEEHSRFIKLSKLGKLLLHPRYIRLGYYDRLIQRRYKEVWEKMGNWIFVARKI